MGEDGHATSCASVATLIDTNVFVYRYDARFRRERQIANDILRWQWRGRALDMVVPADVADETECLGIAHATEDSYT